MLAVHGPLSSDEIEILGWLDGIISRLDEHERTQAETSSKSKEHRRSREALPPLKRKENQVWARALRHLQCERDGVRSEIEVDQAPHTLDAQPTSSISQAGPVSSCLVI